MAKERIFEWLELWAAFPQQPIEIQQGWMTGKNTHGCTGLRPILEDFMKHFPREVQDDVFKYAPKDVQDFFGYVAIADKREVVTASRYNPNRQVAVKKPVYSIAFPEITLQERERIQRILGA